MCVGFCCVVLVVRGFWCFFLSFFGWFFLAFCFALSRGPYSRKGSRIPTLYPIYIWMDRIRCCYILVYIPALLHTYDTLVSSSSFFNPSFYLWLPVLILISCS